ncbi:hypothetical protein GHT06_021605 [Daphnia sinensis]|uniref:Uncharacterized protein n=1 Tax=Daphnia sinensis TaxID=1820382 RepID=A0AAD5KJB6_9CRUS|nr:hypothetical protein GHT06_021605 [Daphnia sinensis]
MQSEDIDNLTLEQCKARQRQLRHKITGCCTRTRRVIASKLSRREAERLLAEARGHLSDSSLINDRLLELLNDEEGGIQHEQFLRYGGDIDSMAEAINNYLASRAGETASVIGDTSNQELVDAEQRVLESQKMYEEAAKAAEAAKKRMEDATKAVHALKNEVEDPDNDEMSDTSSICSVAVHPRAPRTTTAPDDWIEEYCQGKEKQLVPSGDNRYSSAPILWKDGVRPMLPDNQSLAESRLQCLINKFQKTAPEQRYEHYCRKAMQKNFDEGYACRLSPEETASQSGYYLPHFGVPKIPGRPELRLAGQRVYHGWSKSKKYGAFISIWPRRAKLPYDVLHPPILPGPHPLARSIIRAFHEEMHHVGREPILFYPTSGSTSGLQRAAKQ